MSAWKYAQWLKRGSHFLALKLPARDFSTIGDQDFVKRLLVGVDGVRGVDLVPGLGREAAARGCQLSWQLARQLGWQLAKAAEGGRVEKHFNF